MTKQPHDDDQSGNPNTTNDQDVTNDSTSSIEELQAEIARLTAEAAKYRSQKTSIAKERDELKKQIGSRPTDSQEENYKQLWQQERDERQKVIDRAKRTDVENALLTKLTKVGVVPDMIDAAKKLVDHSMIEWDADNGVDTVTVDAAVATLKKSYGFLFERKVSTTQPKSAADGKTDSEGKTINKSEFLKLSPAQQLDKMKQGFTVID